MLRWCDGLEHYGALARMTEGVGGGAAWSEVNVVDGAKGGWALSTTNPATGDYHLRLTSGANQGPFIRRIFGVAKQVVGVGYRFSIASLPGVEGDASGDTAVILADIRDESNGSHFVIVLGTDGSVLAKRGAVVTNTALGGTLLGRSDPCIAPGGYHHFELKAKIDNSTGYIEVRVNEITVLNLTGIDTQNTANATAAQVAIGRSGGVLTAQSANFGTFDFDDPFAWDDDASDLENTVVDFVGDKGVYWLAPDADTATSEFTVTGSATAYGALDEVPPSGTDYLSTASTTARTIVGVEALPGNVSEVIALQPVFYAKKDESGSVTMRGGIVSGAEETYGPEDTPATEFAYLRPGPKTIDPDTGVPWEATAEPNLLIERTA